MPDSPPINTLIAGAVLTGPADASGYSARSTYSTNLYVLVDVNDEKLCNYLAATYLDDSVEVYIDGVNTKGQPPLAGKRGRYLGVDGCRDCRDQHEHHGRASRPDQYAHRLADRDQVPRRL